MSRSSFVLCVCLLSPLLAQPQTRLRLSTVIPGSEKVQLVYNGDFQFQGPLVNNSYPYPDGWARQADMFAGAGINLVQADNGVAAFANVDGGASVCKYERTVALQPATDYVLSAYLWNMGDSANHVTTVVDLNDVPQEPQLTLAWSDAGAAQGYFVYRSFNTTNTGATVTLRVFYDTRTGTGTASQYYPVGAQWDNLAITPAVDFLPPQPAGSGANLRPAVRITAPADGANLALEGSPAGLTVGASAADYDGTVVSVHFYAGTNQIGEATASPYTAFWTNPASGTYTLTAVATDDAGATTVSAPVSVTLTAPPAPVALSIVRHGTNFLVSWPASATASSLQSASNEVVNPAWKVVTSTPAVTNDLNSVTVTNNGRQQFFRLGPEVDPTTLNHKLLMGYQGWFACPNDGSQANKWIHWFRNNSPAATNATVDFWPDISELDPDELFDTAMTLSNGAPARLYSAYKQKTVLRHFKWMKDNHLDGVFLQRFSSSLSNPSLLEFRNHVAANVRLGADTYGRAFAIMYDISGQSASTLVSTLTNDWVFLVNSMQLTQSPCYLRHEGKPVVAIWGFGFNDRPGTPADAQTVVSFFKSAGCTVMGGVPTHWRTLDGDSQTNAAWAAAYLAFDVISPWAVGRYADITGANNFMLNHILPDLTYTRAHGIEYMPVIFPGFSWTNLNQGPFNQIPRNGGAFYWRQAYNAIFAGCNMLYGAMFDEVDEGTAMFKLAPTKNELPAQGAFVPLNVDGQLLPSDWYLRLADQAGRMLRGEIPLQIQMPISP